jgi:26S proteasome regulatory subunit N9
MRAMSLGLIQGSIDQVAGTLAVTFVRPRVLNKGQLVVVKERVDAWLQRSAETLARLEAGTPQEIFA